MAYPFGFEGFENQEGDSDNHPTYEELQSYCDRSLRSFAEIGQDEFMKVEGHVSICDSCLLVLINARIHLLHQSDDIS
jgi:hypothetical protein